MARQTLGKEGAKGVGVVLLFTEFLGLLQLTPVGHS